MSSESTEGRLPKAYITRTSSDNEDKVIYVEFEDGDQRNPQNYSAFKKWAITLTVCCSTGMAAAYASSYSISTPSLKSDLHCTELEAALGLGLYALGFGIAPLFTSSFSEEVGRKPVYIFSSAMLTLAQVMVALAPNVGVLLAGRVFGGLFGSTGASLVGGSIADIWRPQERGLPMTMFAFSMVFAIGLGSVIGGVIESFLGWRWVQWVHVIISCIFTVLVLLVVNETRSSIILIQIARLQRKATGNNMYKAKIELNKKSLLNLIKTSYSRPLYFLLTEPIVQCFSLWCGFVWGVVFALLEAITPMFQTVYGFDVQQTEYIYSALSVGAMIGFCANMYQDQLYLKYVFRKHQEARLYMSCLAAFFLPIGILIFAWTTLPEIHWIVPTIGLTVFMTGATIILQVAFLYLADCYNTYASSAQAGQTLTRSMMACVFPLFTQRMFANLTYKWALTLFAVLALVMAPTPFVLFFYGSKIRARSIASREILAADDQPQHTRASSPPSDASKV